jgi:murein DD-endopeptidase MepM/ murein hydrolase activator NlpD
MSSVKPPDVGQAASQLEAYFLRRTLAEVQPGEGLTGGGFAGGMFKDMLDEAISDAMAKAGGVGIAQAVEDQLDPEGAGPPKPVGPQMRPGPSMAPAGPTGPSLLQNSPLDMPATSSFGTRHDPIEGDMRQHNGLDLGAPEGTPVHAAAAGVVKQAGPAGTYGNLVIVDHGGGLETRYAHLSEVDVHAGARIPAGAQVGAVGHTGRATGPHLHFEIRRDGQPLDPADQISALKFRSGRPNQ